MGVILSDEISPVIHQYFTYIRIPIPTQSIPHNLIHIVIKTFRIGDETNIVAGIVYSENGSLCLRPRIDTLSVLRRSEGEISVWHRILRIKAMRDIRIRPDGIIRPN